MGLLDQIVDQTPRVENVPVAAALGSSGFAAVPDMLLSRLQPIGAAARGLRKTVDQPGDPKGRQCQAEEADPPRQQGQLARHDISETYADQLAGEDVAIDASTPLRLEVVAHQRGDRRHRHRHHRAERQTGEQQTEVRRGGSAEAHGHAPQRDGEGQHTSAVRAIHQPAERKGGDGADEERGGQQQTDLGLADAQALFQLDRHRADRAEVGAAEGKHQSQHRHDMGTGPPLQLPYGPCSDTINNLHRVPYRPSAALPPCSGAASVQAKGLSHKGMEGHKSGFLYPRCPAAAAGKGQENVPEELSPRATAPVHVRHGCWPSR